MDAKQKTNVETLLDKASSAPDGGQACAFSQAACNAANALRVLTEIDRASKPPQS
jgi:hypothetical protein